MKTKIAVAASMAAIGGVAQADSAHKHHGADGHKHAIEAHDHAGEPGGCVLDLWEGITTKAADKGFSFAGEYIYEYSNVLNGGAKSGGSDRNLFVFDAEFDLEKIAGIKGATIFGQFQHASRERDAGHPGDFQGFSNLEVERSLDALYELWFQQELADGKVRVKVGKVDANTEFAYVDAVGGFAHSSAGFSPTILGFPTYPEPAMSVNVFVTVAETENSTFTLGYGFYDGANGVDSVETGRRGPSTFFSDDKSNDYFHVLQLEQTWNDWQGLGEGRLSVGGWHHTGSFDRFDGGSESGTTGFFLTGEQRLTKRSAESEGGVFAFAQYGWADEEVAEVAQHIAVGISAQGTFANREDDAAGVYVSFAKLSGEAGAMLQDDETAVDAFYTFQVSEHLAVQPELQYIFNPGGDGATSDALVGGVRVSTSF